ncbi:hypothetical protein Fcan01_12698 [Folsomia candida]|uniref:Uncharacterized protein n=1 Tax=Folsomia candida TaxID=158441 RepID=A0A226E524_FOLCA|nr:hypothetical protein Fcan01_12698 [Folsomia candida]
MGMKRASSVGTPSIYSHSQATRSHTTTRSHATGMRSARSAKSLQTPWYKRPLLATCFGFDVQRLSLYTAFYSIFISLFTVITSCFDIYCLSEAAPRSVHYGYYLISFDFVYIGNKHVRNSLIGIAVLSTIGGVALFLTTLQLIQALRNVR